jgi:hypothetical protein
MELVLVRFKYSMMKNLLLILVVLFFKESFGQSNAIRYAKIEVEISKEKRPKKIYAKLKILVPFEGGDSLWVSSFENNINHGIEFDNGAKPGKYLVLANFIMSKDGTISDVICLKDPGYGMGEEVVRVLKKGVVKWKPASFHGLPVRELRR